jgi:hypothetical protein
MPRSLHPFALFLALAVGLAFAPGVGTGEGLPITTAPDDQWNPCVVRSPGGGAWVAWLDRRTGYSTDVYSCRLDAVGSPSTGGADQGSRLTWITCLKKDLVLVPDGTGGTLASWSDHRCVAALGYDIYLLRLGSDGLPLPGWPLNGLAVRSASGDQDRPCIAPDGAGGAFVAWMDRGLSPARLFAQHVTAGGILDPAWPAAGVLVASAVSSSAVPSAVSDGFGGCYLAWDDIRDGDIDIRLQRLTATGSPSSGWAAGGVGVCTWISNQLGSVVLAGSSGPTVAWLDRRGGTTQVYASRHLPNGERAPGWPLHGLRVAPSPGLQSDLSLARTSTAGLFVAWSEDRGLGSGADVYVQRLDSTGVALPGWPSDGAVACAAPGHQTEPAIALDISGGIYAGWRDGRDSTLTGSDLYVQRLSSDGTGAPGWPADGYPLCHDAGEQRELQLAPDGLGGAFAVWTDGRDTLTTGDNLASRQVTTAGPVPSRPSGLAALHRDGQTFLTWTPAVGNGWTYRLYASPNPITSAADLASATLVGSVGDSSACDKRLSVLKGALFGYRIEPGGAELPVAGGLFVRTAAQAAATYYAVTGQPGAFAEDPTVIAGDNALAAPQLETPASPLPVYQRTIANGAATVEIWTLWTWNEDVPGFPAMAARPGLAFDCGLVRGGESQAPLTVRFHARGGSLLDATGGAALPGEWVLALDDGLPSGANTFWFGYHHDYDVTVSGNAPPLSGEVVGYTARRVDWTFDWVRRGFPIDTTRVFAYGYSMGAMGSSQLAFRSPGKIAGLMSVIGQFDFSFESDPQPACWFNPGGSFRTLADQIWGPVSSNLPTPEGAPVFTVLNGTHIAESDGGPDLPPMMAFNGRNDLNVGWAEKVLFWEAMEQHQRGGWFFWDNRDHAGLGAAWIPMQVPSYLDRLRTNRSFPALSHCDRDEQLGDGSPASGDSVGTLNGPVEWAVPGDDPGGWSVVLTLRPLTPSTGTIPAPESVLVDVTPRRLQAFTVAPFATVPYRVVRMADLAVLDHGVLVADGLGVVTVEDVRVHRTGTRVEIGAPALADAEPVDPPRTLRLSCPSPARAGSLEALVEWPAAAESRLDLLDVSGRRVRTLFHGVPSAGRARYAAGATGVAPGLYFLSARCGGEQRVQRVVVLR